MAPERSLDSISDEEAHAKCRSNNGERQDNVDSNSMSSRLREEEHSQAFQMCMSTAVWYCCK